jgi:ankyrin repeat protein
MLIEAGALADLCSAALCRLAGLSTAVIQALFSRIVASDLRDEDGYLPLHFAAICKFNPAVLSMLVHVCGVDLDARDRTGNTCAHASSYSESYFQNLHWLVQAGANVDAANVAGLSSIRRAWRSVSNARGCFLRLVQT